MTVDIKSALADPANAQAFIDCFIGGYLEPAYGARSKSEIDILIFGALVKAKAIDPASPIYDLARALNITPAKVRTLIFNWQLRDQQFRSDLTKSLRDALQKTRFSKDGALLTFGIESPLLKEEVIARLKAKGVFADTAFSREIIRMPVEAFVTFLDDIVDNNIKDTIVTTLVKDKQIADKSFKAVVTGALSKLGDKVAGEVGKQIAGDLVDAAKPVAERLGSLLQALLKGDKVGAETAVNNDPQLWA